MDRKFQLRDRYILDLTPDTEKVLDRRLAIALAIGLDTLQNSRLPPRQMHADELETDEALVRRLLGRAVPQWAELPIEALPVGGTDNVIYRLATSSQCACRGGATGRPSCWTESSSGCRSWRRSCRHRAGAGRPRRRRRGVSERVGDLHLADGEDAASVPSTCRARRSTSRRSSQRWGGSIQRGARLRETAAARSGRADEPTRAAIVALGDAIDARSRDGAWEAALAAPEWDRRPCGSTATSTRGTCSSGTGGSPVSSTGAAPASAIRPAT